MHSKRKIENNDLLPLPSAKHSKSSSQCEYDRYVTTSDNLKETLSLYGVAIIPSILDEKECDNMFNGMWNFFEHITQKWTTPLNRNKSETWKEFYRLLPMHSMLVQHWGIGHCQAVWDIRQHPKIIKIFADFWETKQEDLLVSFDAASFSPPPETTGRGFFRGRTWYHSDQSYTHNGFRTAQAWVTALDVEDGDATLAIMEKSHLYHQDFAEHFQIKDKVDWYKLSREEEKFYYDKGCLYAKIKCPRGSLVVWDSRTIHCGVEALKERQHANFRAVIYVCYLPRSTATTKDLEKKRKALESLRTTSHYPNKAKMFSKSPQHYGKGLPIITPIGHPQLSNLGKKLAGL